MKKTIRRSVQLQEKKERARQHMVNQSRRRWGRSPMNPTKKETADDHY